jgi:hypothetical protein
MTDQLKTSSTLFGEKQTLKKDVLEWLAQNGIVPTKVRVYDTRRYGLEVRIYSKPVTFPNNRRSRRKIEGDPNHKTVGVHERTYSNYTAISRETLLDKDEREFALQCLKDNL